MSTKLDFLRRIHDVPKDGAPRMVYADWLDEQGDGESAKVQRWAGELLGGPCTSWQMVWRDGFTPVLPLSGLEALVEALKKDDTKITQGSTTTPPPIMAVQDWPCEAADAIGFVGWQSPELDIDTCGEVEEFFARACFEADDRLKEAAGCRWFLNWFDDTPRDQMRRELIPEVMLAILRIEEHTELALADIPPPPSGDLVLVSTDGVLQWATPTRP